MGPENMNEFNMVSLSSPKRGMSSASAYESSYLQFHLLEDELASTSKGKVGCHLTTEYCNLL